MQQASAKRYDFARLHTKTAIVKQYDVYISSVKRAIFRDQKNKIKTVFNVAREGRERLWSKRDWSITLLKFPLTVIALSRLLAHNRAQYLCNLPFGDRRYYAPVGPSLLSSKPQGLKVVFL
ncbi:hypothetical protein HNR39_001717 [Glaciimonas immobilis]|uniref:Uncharacterized protein n=1 Tax=Glaciimonas immobilis TaxID=728004 RepID=A0A840RQ59_9BURK|nr:hypothetical protein [Glaciimonas immobilis]